MASYRDLISKLSKAWNSPDMMNPNKMRKPKIPFSSPLLNYATYGGIPRNAITEFHGAPSGGKSTTAIDICYNAIKIFSDEFEAQVAEMREKIASGKKEYAGPLEDLLDRGPKRVLYVDLEHSFDFKWARKMGINDGEIDVMQPPDIAAEEIVQAIQDAIATDEVGFVILDSIPSLVPRAELEKKFGERTIAPVAGLMTVFLRKVVSMLPRYDCTMLLINQIRPNMENPYVVNTPGGEAIKFYSSLRLYFRLGSPVDFVGNDLPTNTENPAGYIVNVKVVKQKSAPFDRKIASYFLMAQSGIRPDFDFAKLAINQYGIIKKNGGWFTMCDPETGVILEDEDGKPVKINGQTKVYDWLSQHPEYYEKLKSFIVADINDNGTSTDDGGQGNGEEVLPEY